MTDEERGEHKPSGWLSAGRRNGLMLGAAVLAVGYGFWRGSQDQSEPARSEPFVSVAAPDFNTRPAPVAAPPPPAAPPAAEAPRAFAPPQPVAPSLGAASKPPRMLSYAVPAPPAPAQTSPASGIGQEGRGTTAVAYKPAEIPGAKAGPAIDMATTLMPGVYTCVLDTAVNSERPGPFQCHTEDDIHSPLRVKLMAAGTVITGNVQGGDVRPGQSRVPAATALAITPEGIPVPLGAPVGDELGGSGMPGRVNRHLAERYGGAVFLLLSQGAIDLARAALTRGGNNTFLSLNTSGVQGITGEVARRSMDMPNTVEKNQGERIAFFVTTPVSFADAIKLRPVR